MPVRSARTVSAILKRAGIPVGARYTQTGIVGRDGARICEPTTQVTRQREARYGGMEDTGGVDVYPYHPDGFSTPQDLIDRAIVALRAAGLPAKYHRGSVRVDDEDLDLGADPLEQDMSTDELTDLLTSLVRATAGTGTRSVREHLTALTGSINAILAGDKDLP